MEQSTARVRRHRASRTRRGLLVAAVCIASIGLLSRMGFGVSQFPTFEGACSRIRQSGLPILAADWFCHPPDWWTHFVANSVLMSAGLMLPGVVLAASGRRFTAFLPLLAGGLFASWWWGVFSWGDLRVIEGVTGGLLLAAPAMAIAWLRRAPPPSSVPIRLLPAVVSGVVIIVAARMVVDQTQRMRFGEWSSDLVAPAVIIGLLAALLGTDRRWWPWIVAPAAVLLSPGPSVLTAVDPAARGWWGFTYALPLALVGLVCSAWHPLATRLQRWRALADPARPSLLFRVRPRRVPFVALNGAAAILLVVSFVTSSMSHPAFERAARSFAKELQAAENWRARMDAREALRVTDGYFAERRTYRGFDATDGLLEQPSFVWLNGIRDVDTLSSSGRPAVAIVGTSPDSVQIVTWGRHGATCIQRVRGVGISYGQLTSDGWVGETARAAVEFCGATPWTRDAAEPPPPFACPPEVVDYVFCRMTEVRIYNLTTREPPF